MQLEEYFDFQAPNDIRLKGSRIGIETILYDYIFRSMTAEEIQRKWDSLTLEQVYATLLYYHRHRAQVDQYLTDLIEWGRQARAEQAKNMTPTMKRIAGIIAERQATRRRAALLVGE